MGIEGSTMPAIIEFTCVFAKQIQTREWVGDSLDNFYSRYVLSNRNLPKMLSRFGGL